MAYTLPKTRSCDALDGQRFYPDEGSVLDLQKWRRTPKIANIRLVQYGDKVYAEDDFSRPVKLVGNNTSVSKFFPLDPAKIDQIIMKYKTRGYNYIRLHHIEAYLMQGGPLYSADIPRIGTRNYDPDRWAELDLFIYRCKMAGIYVSFGIASGNMALNTRGVDRWGGTVNTTGTINLTIVGGVITAAVPGTANSTPYPDPPSVVISDVAGSSGNGAVIRAVINDTTGAITGYVVENGGSGYSSSATAVNYGGPGRAGYRLRFDNAIRQHWKDVTCTDFLGHVNPYTGLRYADDPVIFMVECINEAHMANLFAAYNVSPFNGSAGVPTQLRPQFVNYLAARFGTPANMNAILGTSITGFWDSAAAPRSPGFGPDGTQPSRKFYWECQKWANDADVELYGWMVQQIKATGYKGLICARDIVGDPIIPRIYNETGANMQAVHAYPALIDSTTPGTAYKTSQQTANAPVSYAFGSNPLYACLGAVTADVPWMFTEFGYPWPGKYRGEYGLLAGAYGCSHNATGVTYHGDYPVGLEFGLNNRSGTRGQRPHGYEHDPNGNVSTWLGNLILHRGDVAELPITKTLTLNNRAVYNIADTSQIAAITYNYGFRMIGYPPEYLATVMVGRMVNKWDTNPDPTAAAAIGTAWYNDINRSTFSAQLGDHSLSTNDATYWWTVTQGNITITNGTDQSVTAMRYTKRTPQSGNRAEVFSDRVSGLFGINTPRTQALVASGKFAQAASSVVRAGNGFITNTARTSTAAAGYAYDKNAKGDRFFEDLTIDFIEDGTLFAVTSADLTPIASADRMIVVACSNFYNTGQSAQPAGKILTGFTLNGGTGYPNVTEWGFSGGGGSASVLVYSVGGVPTSYKIVDQQGSFTGNPTTFFQASGGGSGLTFTNFTLVDDTDSKDVTFLTASNGVNDGWPLLQQNFVVHATLRGVDTSVPWALYELDFSGNRIGTLPVKRSSRGLHIIIDSTKTKKPSVFFELVKGARSFKGNPNLS